MGLGLWIETKKSNFRSYKPLRLVKKVIHKNLIGMLIDLKLELRTLCKKGGHLLHLMDGRKKEGR